MFFISDIYDNVTSYHATELVSGGNNRGYRTYKNTIHCELDGLNSILLCVYDSTDNSSEWYSVIDILKLLATTKVSITGVEYQFYAWAVKGHRARPDYLDSLKSLTISVSISNSSKAHVTTIAKMKLLGVDITTDGTLSCMHDSFVHGDSIILPNEVKYLGHGFYRDSNMYNVKKLVVSDNFCFNDNNTCFQLKQFFKQRLKNAVLVIDGDLRVTPSSVYDLKMSMYVRGKLSLGDFKKVMESLSSKSPREYRRFTGLRGEYFIVADKDYIYTLDFIQYRVLRKANDGSFTF